MSNARKKVFEYACFLSVCLRPCLCLSVCFSVCLRSCVFVCLYARVSVRYFEVFSFIFMTSMTHSRFTKKKKKKKRKKKKKGKRKKERKRLAKDSLAFTETIGHATPSYSKKKKKSRYNIACLHEYTIVRNDSNKAVRAMKCHVTSPGR